MKTTLITIAMVCIILLEQGFSQVTGVKYLLKYNSTSCRFDACIVITAGSATTAPQRAQFNSQYSLVVPTGSSVSIAQNYNPIQNNQTYAGVNPLVWVISSSVLAPAAAPTLDFYSVTPTLSPTSFYNNITVNDTVRLFSVNITPFPNCGVGIRSFQNGVDPGSSAAGMNGGDFTNGFTIGGTSQDYQGNLSPILPTPPVLSALTECAEGISINASVSASSCQSPFTFQWSGPNGYNGTSEDVNIVPANFATNGGTYQVIVTDKLSCKDTLYIDAYPKPSGGNDVLICGPSQVTLTGTNPTSGNWSASGANPAGSVIGSTNNGEVNIDFSSAADGIHTYYYTAGTCSDTVAITKSFADAGPDPAPVECFASGFAGMSAVGVGSWSLAQGSAGTAFIETANSPTTNVSQFSVAGNYFMVWSSTGCSDTVLVTVGSNCSGCPINNNLITPPSITSYCGSSGPVTILGNTANPSPGFYHWEYSINNGVFSDAPGVFNTEDYTSPSFGAGNHTFRRIYTKTEAPACSDTSVSVSFMVTENPNAPSGLSANPNPSCLGNIVGLSVNNETGTFNWTASSPEAGLTSSTTNSTTMMPVSAGLYTISVTRTDLGCTSAPSTVNVNVIDTPPTPGDVSYADPTSCGGNQGSITIGGLAATTTYTVNYFKNGIPVSVNLTSNGSGDLTIINLESGNYTNISLASGICISGEYSGPVTLIDPNAPAAPQGISATEVAICANTTTTVSVTNTPNAVYTWASSNPAVLALQSPSNSNSATFIGLMDGNVVVSVTQSVGVCTSPPATIDIVVFPASPTPSTLVGNNPTICEGSDGSISISGLPANTTYSLYYQRNGWDMLANITSNGAGVAILNSLIAAEYTNFELTNAFNCVSDAFAGPVTLVDPSAVAPIGLAANPNPACTGSTVNLSLQFVPGAAYSWSASAPEAGLGSSMSNSVTMIPDQEGVYTISVIQTVAGCVSPPAEITVYVRNDCYHPDFGVTYKDIELTGDLTTNDGTLGSDYQSAIPNPLNPSACLPTIFSNGNYTFICSMVGEYNFLVPVCQGDNCVNVPLSITVLEEESVNNPPIAHHDYVTTIQNTAVKIAILANDKCQSVPNCTLDAPTVITPPAFGTYNGNTGMYTPANGFIGRDSFKYRVCQTPAIPFGNCDEEWVYIKIFPSVATNFTNAMDDYAQTTLNTALSANAVKGVKANDTDLEGNLTTVTPQSINVPGKGSLTLQLDGSYSFSPEPNFIGPVDFPYEICDDGNPMACSNATLHILVESSLPTGSIGDYVWYDQNGNGVQNPGEPGIANVQVSLFNEAGTLMAVTTSGPNGAYRFDNVIPGNYYLKFDKPSGYEVTTAFNGDPLTDSDLSSYFGLGTTGLFTLNAGEFNLSIDAGFYICSRIGNAVWYDANKNDKWETTENGINGLQVNLWRNVNGSWILWDTQITGHKPNTPSDDGWYEFCAPPGTYYVQVILPPNNKLVAVKPFIGGNPFRDSDITNSNGPVTTNSFTLAAGQNKLDLGAGFYPMAIAGNLVWLDSNMNGIQDSGEPKLSGVLVQAYEAGTNMMYGSAVTDAQGIYTIEYLPKAEMYYKFTPPAGLNATYPNMGSDVINSDVDHSNGLNTTRVFNMSPGVFNENIDLGLAAGALPVTWVKVEAQKLNDGHLISWQTSNEVNLAYYEVQAYLPNEKTFITISDKVIPKPGTESVKEYQFLNENVERIGWHHYRIRQVDFDGSESYSARVYVLNETETRLSIYPNPAINRVELGIDLENEAEIEIFVYNIKGEIISKLSYNRHFERGSHAITFEVGDLPAGIYTFNTLINGNLTSKMVVKE
ncbi:MAG: cadherin-like domain-containing protein [Saprospiraceae bacterium]|nr:cadherin-like domain-containing protein [Saprospiraceae bacterium]